jgi:hypothetical protein
MTQHGNAKVRPDGKVNLGVTIDADLYRMLYDWSREWGLSMGEVIERLLRAAQRPQ